MMTDCFERVVPKDPLYSDEELEVIGKRIAAREGLEEVCLRLTNQEIVKLLPWVGATPRIKSLRLLSHAPRDGIDELVWALLRLMEQNPDLKVSEVNGIEYCDTGLLRLFLARKQGPSVLRINANTRTGFPHEGSHQERVEMLIKTAGPHLVFFEIFGLDTEASPAAVRAVIDMMSIKEQRLCIFKFSSLTVPRACDLRAEIIYHLGWKRDLHYLKADTDSFTFITRTDPNPPPTNGKRARALDYAFSPAKLMKSM